MTELEKKMIAAAGLKEADFTPKKPVYQRLAEIEKSSEDVILLIADMIGGD